MRPDSEEHPQKQLQREEVRKGQRGDQERPRSENFHPGIAQLERHYPHNNGSERYRRKAEPPRSGVSVIHHSGVHPAVREVPAEDGGVLAVAASGDAVELDDESVLLIREWKKKQKKTSLISAMF